MLLDRDEPPGKQGGGFAAGIAPAVDRLLGFQPELGKLLALVLLIILSWIVVDFKSRPRVVLRPLLRCAQLLGGFEIVVVVEFDFTRAEPAIRHP